MEMFFIITNHTANKKVQNHIKIFKYYLQEINFKVNSYLIDFEMVPKTYNSY